MSERDWPDLLVFPKDSGRNPATASGLVGEQGESRGFLSTRHFSRGPAWRWYLSFQCSALRTQRAGRYRKTVVRDRSAKADGVGGQENGGSTSACRCAGERSLGVRYSVHDSAAGGAPRKPAVTPYDGLMIASPTGWPPSMRTRRPSTCSRPSAKSCTALG